MMCPYRGHSGGAGPALAAVSPAIHLQMPQCSFFLSVCCTLDVLCEDLRPAKSLKESLQMVVVVDM